MDGIQDGMVLSDRVQIDETFYPVPGKEAVTVDGKLLRGLSRNKICIAIGCDNSGHSFFRRAGFGKPSAKRVVEAYSPHIERGSLLTHDMEKALEDRNCVAHSDQGFQYQHIAYQSLLEDIGCIQPMSRRDNCLDNAPAESFFGRLKVEFFYDETFNNLDDFYQKLDEIHLVVQ